LFLFNAEVFCSVETTMEKKEVFCKARYKHRNIPLDDCIPNPNHPACQGCHSPKIDLLKEEEQKYFRKKAAAAGAAGKNKKKSKAEATEQDTVYLDLDEEPVEEDLLADDEYFDDEADV
jgi:hypothetical protein